MKQTRFFVLFGFIFTALLSRFLPHPPNFTAINAVALFSAYAYNDLRLSFAIVCCTMLLSDLVLGLHSLMPFVYFCIGAVTLMSKIRFRCSIPVTLTAGSILFFLVVNFGVWQFDGIYPNTLEGLALCYIAALPFFANQLLGDLLFGALLFGLFSLSEKYFPALRVEALR